MARETLKSYLGAFSQETGTVFSVSEFANAVHFLTNDRTDYEIVFLDIDMPHMDGMDAAQRLRERDSAVYNIFVTNMAQNSQKGYAVNALDFLVKPIPYRDFRQTMQRSLDGIRRTPKQAVRLKNGEGTLFLYPSQIYYVEIENHRIVYHTEKGPVRGYGTMKRVVAELPFSCFVLCHASYYVNMQYVTEVKNLTVTVHDVPVPVSRPRKAALMKALNAYLGGV